MLTKIKKWFNNLFEIKCPSCKSTELKVLEKEFLYTTEKPYYNHSKLDSPNDRAMKEKISTPIGYDKYKVYDIKYKCKKCNTIFNKKKEI